jgi:rhodanese-related sulfurtransferase
MLVHALTFAAAIWLPSGAGDVSTPSCAPAAAEPAAAGKRSTEPGTLSLAQVSERLKQGRERTVIFDANPHEMYVERHIPGARWVAYDGVTAKVLPADRSTPIVFYCANPACSASPQAARQAMALGWTNVFVMPEGIFGWVRAGLPVEPG